MDARGSPPYPGRFAHYANAQQWCTAFFRYYNDEHRHSGIAYQTPASVHAGHAPAHLAQRDVRLRAAYQQHPERFV